MKIRRLFPPEYWLFLTLYFAFIYIIRIYYPPLSSFYNLVYVFTYISVSFLIISFSKNIEMPEGQLVFLNAGFSRWQLLFMFGSNLIITLTALTLFLFPPEDLKILFYFLSSVCYIGTFEIVWLRKGIQNALLLTYFPYIVALAISIYLFFGLNKIFKVEYNSLNLAVFVFSAFLILFLYQLYSYFKKDIV